MNKLRSAIFGAALALSSGAALAGGWIELGIGFLTYKDASLNAVLNLAVHDHYLLAASSGNGMQVIDLRTGDRKTLPPPEGLDSVDDVAVADGLVFVLDAREPGAVAVLNPANNWAPSGPARAVDVGPFSGVAAAAGVMVVSGGTKPMSWFGYDTLGATSDIRSRPDFGRGQPDVALTPNAEHALISAHIVGPDFGVIWAEVVDEGLSAEPLSYIALPDAGFTRGGQRPANFPIQSVLADDIAFVAHGGGVAAIKLANNTAELLSITDVGYPLTAITLSGEDIIVAGRQSGVVKLTRLRWQSSGAELSGEKPPGEKPSGEKPSEMSVESESVVKGISGEVSDLLVRGGRLYLAAGESGLVEAALP